MKWGGKRKGAGRKRSLPKGKKRTATFEMLDRHYRFISRTAEKMSTTKSGALAFLLDQAAEVK